MSMGPRGERQEEIWVDSHRLVRKRMFEDLVDTPEVARRLAEYPLSEVVADKGYPSNGVLEQRAAGIRTYISEPARGHRNWKNKEEEKFRKAVVLLKTLEAEAKGVVGQETAP